MLNFLAFFFCNTSHIKHMERGHSENGASHYFLQIFPAEKEAIDFSAYLTLHLRDLLYLHFHTTTCNMVPCVSLVTRSQHVNPLLRIFTFLETCEWPVLALRRSPQWMVDTNRLYSLILILTLPVPPTFEPWTYTVNMQSYRENPEPRQCRGTPGCSDRIYQGWHCRGSFESCLHALSEFVHFIQTFFQLLLTLIASPIALSLLIPKCHQYFSGLHTWWVKHYRAFLSSLDKCY